MNERELRAKIADEMLATRTANHSEVSDTCKKPFCMLCKENYVITVLAEMVRR